MSARTRAKQGTHTAPLTGRKIRGSVGGVMPVYRRMHGAASCRMSDSVAEIGVDGALCHIGVSNSIPGFLPRSWGSVSYEVGKVEHGGLRG